MKSIIPLLILLLIFVSCNKQKPLSDQDKELVKNEVLNFLKEVESTLENPSPEDYFNYFLHTDELAVASMGQLVTSSAAIHDTIRKHLSVVKKQEIKPIAERIFVINRESAVISTSKTSTITFLDDSQVTMPYAWTLLAVKREGAWKIAHIHN